VATRHRRRRRGTARQHQPRFLAPLRPFFFKEWLESAGEDPAVVLNAVKAGKGAYGYNAGTGEYGDMLEEGILDPAKVTRLALQNAASVAGLLLTTEVMIAEAPKEDEHSHGGAPGGMGGMGGMDM